MLKHFHVVQGVRDPAVELMHTLVTVHAEVSSLLKKNQIS